MFWGVQYHPEIGLDEVAGALRRQADGLVDAGLAGDREDVEASACLVDALHLAINRRDLAWRLSLDDQVTDDIRRLTELRNFIETVARCGREGPFSVGK